MEQPGLAEIIRSAPVARTLVDEPTRISGGRGPSQSPDTQHAGQHREGEVAAGGLGLFARKARIRLSVASCSCSGMTSIPAFVARVATRESAVRRCPCGNSACSGEPNWAARPVPGRCAFAVSARQLLSVSRGPPWLSRIPRCPCRSSAWHGQLARHAPRPTRLLTLRERLANRLRSSVKDPPSHLNSQPYRS
jgi:hypothetical protein